MLSLTQDHYRQWQGKSPLWLCQHPPYALLSFCHTSSPVAQAFSTPMNG